MTEQVWRVSADVACVQSADGDRVAVLHLEQDVPFILVGTAAVRVERAGRDPAPRRNSSKSLPASTARMPPPSTGM